MQNSNYPWSLNARGGRVAPLALQPLLALVVLTMGAGAMAAGMGHEQRGLTFGALSLHQGTRRGTAELHSRQGMALARQDRLGVLGEILCLEGLDNR